jgi:hypothetical protein
MYRQEKAWMFIDHIAQQFEGIYNNGCRVNRLQYQ